MKLLKFNAGRLVPALEEPPVEVSLEDWRANPQAHAGATALKISNAAPLDEIAGDLSGFSVVILAFPGFKDGRAYSQARLLRERFGYTGEVRARGEILRDQIFFMARCGFDAFEFSGADADSAAAALKDFSHFYQAAADGAAPVWRRRLARAAAA